MVEGGCGGRGRGLAGRGSAATWHDWSGLDQARPQLAGGKTE
jgi:hypothetical protein